MSRLAGAAALAASLLIAQQVASRALRDALFLSAYSVASLPGMLLASALVAIAGSLVFAAALARRPPAAVLGGALALQAALLVAEWAVAGSQPRLVAAALYVQVALLGPGIVSGFWSLVNEHFDPHSARRAMGSIGTGASLGGVAGGALAWAGARVFPLSALLLGLALLSLLALFVVRSLRSAGDMPAPADAAAVSGLRTIRQFPYLQQLAALVALGALAEVLLDYLLKAGAARAFADAASLARFFSLFYAGVALATLLVQATASRRSLERLGLAGTVSLQPAAVALASLVGLLLPSLALAAAARGLGSALRDSLFRSGYELFYAPLPPWQKRRSKALVDVAADKLGALAGALLLMLLAVQRPVSDRWLWLLAFAAMLVSILLARRLHLGYVRALETSLRSGLVELQPDEVLDSTTRLTLTRSALDRQALLAEIRALDAKARPPAAAAWGDPFLQLAVELRSGDAERIRAALAAADPADPGVTQLLLPLLGRDELFADVLRLLRRGAPRVTGQLIDAMLDAGQPARVRRRVPRVLKACPTARATSGLLLGLQDSDFGVRRACGSVLAWMRERYADLAVPAPPVYAAVARELETSADEPEAQLDHVFALLQSVGEREPLRATRSALRGPDQRLRGTALEYLEQVLPEAVRRPLLRRLGTAAVPVARPRALDEVEEELRKSVVSLPRVRRRP